MHHEYVGASSAAMTKWGRGSLARLQTKFQRKGTNPKLTQVRSTRLSEVARSCSCWSMVNGQRNSAGGCRGVEGEDWFGLRPTLDSGLAVTELECAVPRPPDVQSAMMTCTLHRRHFGRENRGQRPWDVFPKLSATDFQIRNSGLGAFPAPHFRELWQAAPPDRQQADPNSTKIVCPIRLENVSLTLTLTTTAHEGTVEGDCPVQTEKLLLSVVSPADFC